MLKRFFAPEAFRFFIITIDLLSVQPCHNTRSSSMVTLARPPTQSSLKITNRSFRYAAPCHFKSMHFHSFILLKQGAYERPGVCNTVHPQGCNTALILFCVYMYLLHMSVIRVILLSVSLIHQEHIFSLRTEQWMIRRRRIRLSMSPKASVIRPITSTQRDLRLRTSTEPRRTQYTRDRRYPPVRVPWLPGHITRRRPIISRRSLCHPRPASRRGLAVWSRSVADTRRTGRTSCCRVSSSVAVVPAASCAVSWHSVSLVRC